MKDEKRGNRAVNYNVQPRPGFPDDPQGFQFTRIAEPVVSVTPDRQTP
jgi:hypothetical protein